jgi:hypothetical protein
MDYIKEDLIGIAMKVEAFTVQEFLRVVNIMGCIKVNLNGILMKAEKAFTVQEFLREANTLDSIKDQLAGEVIQAEEFMGLWCPQGLNGTVLAHQINQCVHIYFGIFGRLFIVWLANSNSYFSIKEYTIM